MSTHRRAWKQRAGVVVALVVGALLAAPATPASAAPNINNVSASPSRVEAGGTTTISYSIRITADKAADVTVSSSNSKLVCVDGCSRSGVEESGDFQATFRLARDAADGQATITVKALDPDGEQSRATNVTLVGAPAPQPTQAQTVRSVSGKVVNQSGDPVPNAYVVLKDAKGNNSDTVANDSGNFRFTGTSDKPIAPGRLSIGASFDNVYATKSFDASAGQSVTGQRIALAIKVETTPSATPSASEEPLPSDEPVEETPEESAEATPGAAANASNEDSGGMGSWLIILLGGLLVAAGVGTIVLLLMRRKDNGDEADDDAPAGAAAGAVPAARGAFRGADDQTRVVNRVGATPDPTMVGGAALSDAPTMMHRPVVDDVPPDPYGAPPQPYGAAGNQQGWGGSGYGDEPAGAGGYGGAGHGNAPASGSGYSSGGSGAGYGDAPASGGGYGSNDYGAPAGVAGYPPAVGDRGYDEPTGRWAGDATQYPAPADPYSTGVYRPEQGQSYSQSEPGGYGRGGESTGSYGQGSYGQGDYGQGDYGQGSYGQGSYGQGSYGQDPSQQRGSYEDRTGYDDQRTGRDRPDGPPHQPRGGRRLDWLDD
ncbi:carboxypeptidase regulatory-like domain-containing protein [Micromonospora echinofusca]